MRISALSAHGVPPIEKFEVDNLGDFVVIAGRNGAGKSRLLQTLIQKFRNINLGNIEILFEATSAEEISEIESVMGRPLGSEKLDTRIPNIKNFIVNLFQKNKRRQNLTSSVIVYGSDRKVQNVANLAFAFDFPDPFTENIGWDIGFQEMGSRWADTQHAIFKKIHRQTTSIASRARALKAEGKKEMGLEFDDPLEPFRDIFLQLLGPKRLVRADLQSQQLIVEFEGIEFPITQLSSGEREVLSISFDLLLRKPSDCIIVFDEPELHLHPELLARLISTLQDIGNRNQFILVTHSSEIISSADPESIVFLRPPDGDKNQAVKLSEEREAQEILEELGQSLGVISLGRRIVLIEGNEASTDKLTYLAISESEFPNLVLLPASGRDRIRSFADVKKEILDKSLWGIKFFMLTDGDYGPHLTEGGGLRKLPRYHIENYFLDETTIAHVFEGMDPKGSDLLNPEFIRSKLIELAKDNITYAAALTTAAQVRHSIGSVDLMIKGANGLTKDQFLAKVVARGQGELSRVLNGLDERALVDVAALNYDAMTSALLDGDRWKTIFPAKAVVARFCSFAGIANDRFKRLYIKSDGQLGGGQFDDVRSILREFASS